MQFEVQLNGKPQYVVGHGERGSVGVHINAHEQGEDVGASAMAAAYDTTSLSGFISRKWAELPLKLGDEIVVRCVTGATLTSPSREKSFLNDDRICITNRKVAEDVAASIDEIVRALFALADLVKQHEGVDNAKKFASAVGSVVAETGHILGPIYNAFPDLRPNALRDTPL